MKTDSDLFEMIAHQTFWSWVIFRLSSVVAGLYFRFTDSEKKERICAIVWVSLASILFLYVVLYVVPFGA